MSRATEALILAVVLGAVRLGAQVILAPTTMRSSSEPGADQPAANTLVLGTSTGMVYDSNVLSSQPPVQDVQFTLYPLVGLRLERPMWDALVSFVPGLSYSTASLPQYEAMSLTANLWLQSRPTERLSLEFTNDLISSSNPFDSLVGTAGSGSSSGGQAAVTNLNYLPRTNESASAGAAYNLSTRTSLKALASYNYISYQNNPDLPAQTQLFQQTNSGQILLSLSHGLSPKYRDSVQYVGQIIDAGQGRIKTVGHSVQYGLTGTPTPNVKLSVYAGPQYVQNTYSDLLSLNRVSSLKQIAGGWTWAGSASIGLTFGKTQVQASAFRQLGTGNQYQGSVRQSSIELNYIRQFASKTELMVFSSYNVSTPVFVAQAISRVSNNYSSSGAAISKRLLDRWLVSCAYWYLFQNGRQTTQQLYSGDHNRVALSLSYSLSKPLPR